MRTDYCERGGLRVSNELAQLIEQELSSVLALDTARFWSGFAALLDKLNASCSPSVMASEGPSSGSRMVTPPPR